MKDRVALHIIEDAFAEGLLQQGGLITEGTAGSTGLHTTSALHIGMLAWVYPGALAVHSFSACFGLCFDGPRHLLICTSYEDDLHHCWR